MDSTVIWILVGVVVFLFLMRTSFGKGVLEQAYVLDVLDGDTLLVANQQHKEGVKVQLIGIDVPEEGENYSNRLEQLGRHATHYLRGILHHRTKIWLEYDRDKWDSYHRLQAYVYLPSSKRSINAELIRKGYAFARTKIPNTRYKDQFKQLEEKARRRRIGIWKYHGME
ncbi:MAG TPA: nuclease [Microscillaceae bacterium]|jgi:micrococcal nuclease|nr:nuclease [Microscillaceae bacterium]